MKRTAAFVWLLAIAFIGLAQPVYSQTCKRGF